eukprot:3813269-Pleurochrysis_carterae.AAC.4
MSTSCSSERANGKRKVSKERHQPQDYAHAGCSTEDQYIQYSGESIVQPHLDDWNAQKHPSRGDSWHRSHRAQGHHQHEHAQAYSSQHGDVAGSRSLPDCRLSMGCALAGTGRPEGRALAPGPQGARRPSALSLPPDCRDSLHSLAQPLNRRVHSYAPIKRFVVHLCHQHNDLIK